MPNVIYSVVGMSFAASFSINSPLSSIVSTEGKKDTRDERTELLNDECISFDVIVFCGTLIQSYRLLACIISEIPDVKIPDIWAHTEE